MHELEKGNARHDPPAVMGTDKMSITSDTTMSSSRKRAKASHKDMLSDDMEKQEQRNDELLAEIRKSNEEKGKMREVLERLVDKF